MTRGDTTIFNIQKGKASLKQERLLTSEETKPEYVVATIDLDSTDQPDYAKLDKVFAGHGLFASRPPMSMLPCNTYL